MPLAGTAAVLATSIKDGLGDIVVDALAEIDELADDAKTREIWTAVCDKLADRIAEKVIDHFIANALVNVSTTVAVASVAGVTPGPGVSGPGAGTGTGTGTLA
jgi:hypothetical protein